LKKRGKMDPTVFALAMQRLGTDGGASYEAARLVLCEAKRPGEAVRIARTHRQNLHKAIAKIESAFEELGICPYCGHKLPNV
jgi:hypothetical protein